MSEQLYEPIAGMVNEFIGSTGFTDSWLGHITKSLINKALKEYMQTENKRTPELSSGNRAKFGKFAEKWCDRIFADLSKMNLSDTEKKVLIGFLAASLVTQIMPHE